MPERVPLDRQSDVVWRTTVLALREQNPQRSIASIAREVGIEYSRVWAVLNPERRAEHHQRVNAKRAPQKRAWEQEHDRGTCPRCGGQMGVGSARKRNQLCSACSRADRRLKRVERARTIERMWATGAPVREIATALDTTPGTVGVEINRLRQEGLVDLPFRYQRRDGRRTAA